MTSALGIAGSLACGLMEFARSGTGAMVKRLHLGRAAESGVLAASLAADGFTGPQSVIEGEAGFLKVFCTEWDLGDVTRGLGSEFATLNLCLKRFPVHMTAHTAVQAVLELQAEYRFNGADVDRVTVAGTERMATINNIADPTDIMMAQYSIPFCVALALFRDPAIRLRSRNSCAAGCGDPRDVRSRRDNGGGSADQGCRREHRHDPVEGWTLVHARSGGVQRHAGSAARSGRAARQVHDADARSLRRRGDGIVRAPAEPGGRNGPRMGGRIVVGATHARRGGGMHRSFAACVAILLSLWLPALADDTPKRGGILTFMIPANSPPSFDGHREATFATIHAVAPFYSVLIRANPDNPAVTTEFVCDVCTEIPATDDGRTYAFPIRDDVRFQDGSALTAYDVAASWNHIVDPPNGVISVRQATIR